MALAVSLDLTPAVAPTPIGCSDALVTVLLVPLLTMFSSQSDLVKVTPVITQMLFSLNQRNFRCFRVGGSARFVSLIPPAGPVCQPHILLLPTRTAALGHPLRRRRACAHAPPPLLVPCAAAPPPLTRRSATDRAPTRRRSHATAPRTPAPRSRRQLRVYAARTPLLLLCAAACSASTPFSHSHVRAFKAFSSSLHP